MKLEVGPAGDYEAPSCFQEDLFAVLGDQRPDHRWLIIGPERSGSTFHKDPNATSAWNAVVRGSKYWIMFPPYIMPPGVFVSDDQSEVTSPLSIGEWLLSFHEEARQTSGCLEGVCEEGEVLHVPSGWWHLVVNLDPAIAITQNFVPRSHVGSVVDFLDRKRAQISGFKDDVTDPLELFLGRLKEEYPGLAVELKRDDADKSRKRKWEEVVAPASVENASSGAFSFGFGDDLESEPED
ncbi:F-box protein [Cyphellophora attinorum]|uniref:F-box protein n=1 Tax=Cyphellophora attinorum TaxID=1664694 RepID=A0A0N1NZ63_9EURO|nr:F-box protein [Phialophora attinorum]KPI41040.1 F-box protein [Phialophora attinorum]